MTKEKILSVFEDINLMYNNPNMYDVLSKMLDKLVEDSKKSVDPEKCGDCVSRQAAIDALNHISENYTGEGKREWHPHLDFMIDVIKRVPSVEPERKIGYCKGCKYFEYDSVAKVDEVQLIVAHEICKRWGDGCKTSEDGYCFLYEPQEMEVDG